MDTRPEPRPEPSRRLSVVRDMVPDPAGPGRVLGAMGRLENTTLLDGVIGIVRRAVRAVPLGGARDALHGRWLGHPVHPLMVQLPIGAWLSSAVLDLSPRTRWSSRALVAVGLAGAGPAAWAGWVDWAELHKEQMRVGLVHAVANSAAVACYAGSLTARLTGRERLGRALGFAGLAGVAAGGALGGHLAYRQAAGVNHAEAVVHLVEPGWTSLGPYEELPVGRAVKRYVGDVPLLVLRAQDGTTHALAERCSHLGGPLSQGEIADGCVRCPWHGSLFRLSDGWNVEGPATAPQPAFDTRVVDGEVLARLRPDWLRPAPFAERH
jgi:nitrite reductase/ring-hydroxylating ferredoxin subunit